MKSWRCFDEITDPLNLWRAWGDFERGRRRHPAVAAFSLDADRHVFRLARELAAGAWRPGPYRLLFIDLSRVSGGSEGRDAGTEGQGSAVRQP